MGFMDTLQKESSYSEASGNAYQYVVLQVTLKDKFIGTGSGNLTELERVINEQAAKGYRLHTITTANGGSKGLMGGDRIQATMVFEKVNGDKGKRKRPPGVPVGVRREGVLHGEHQEKAGQKRQCGLSGAGQQRPRAAGVAHLPA